jgi:hypothetical protein
MPIIALLITFAGFLISFASLLLASAAGERLALVLAGIAVSLFGILRVLNSHYLSKAIWRR